MKPLKKKDLVEMTAEDLGLGIEITEAAVDCYWKELLGAVRNMKHLNIKIVEIGELRIARSKLDRAEENVNKLITKYPEGHWMRDHAEEKLDGVLRMKEMRDQEYKKREDLNKRRSEYEQNKKGLAEQVEDIGRTVV